MPLPSTLALTTISGQISASPHNSNYGAVQVAVNALLGILDDGTAGDVLGGVGTALSFAKPPGYQYGVTRGTALAQVIAATTDATATTILTAPAVTLDGTTSVLVTVYSPAVLVKAGHYTLMSLYDDTGSGAASIGQVGYIQNQTASDTNLAVTESVYLLTPSAASHTYSWRAFCDVANQATFNGGAGGAATLMPAYIRVTKAA